MRVKVALLAFAASLAAASGALAQDAPAAAAPPPPGPGLDLINQRCVSCHTTSTIFSQRMTPEGWAQTVQVMADRGAEVSPEEQAAIVQYLSKNYAGSGKGVSADGGAGPGQR
jgi:mono/diheme cytochrome c family protein